MRLHLVPLLPRRDDLERGGGGRLTRERRRDGGRGGGQRRAEEGFGREGEAGCAQLPSSGSRGDGEGRGAREGERQRHGFSVPPLPLRSADLEWDRLRTDGQEIAASALVVPGGCVAWAVCRDDQPTRLVAGFGASGRARGPSGEASP